MPSETTEHLFARYGPRYRWCGHDRLFFHSDTLTSFQRSANSATLELLHTMEGLLAHGGVPEELQGPVA